MRKGLWKGSEARARVGKGKDVARIMMTCLFFKSSTYHKTKGALLAAGLIFALSLAAYSNSFTAEFHFDDYHQIVMNQHIRDTANLARFFTDATLGSYDPSLTGYRPMTYASFAVNYALTGNDVLGYHALNFLLHFLNAFLIYLIVGSVLREAGKESPGAALLASLLFALHPLGTSAVTYVSGRSALLASLFVLLGFYGFLRHRDAGGKCALAWAALAPVFYLLGLLSKEMAVCLPALMVVYDMIFTVRKRGGLAGSLRAAIYYAPFLAALGMYLYVKKAVSGYVTVPKLPFGVPDYLLSEAKVLLLYVRLMLLPVNQNVDYNLPVTHSADAAVMVSALLVAAALIMLYRLRTKEPAAAFFGFWFFIALAPEATFVPIPDVAVEYRVYLPAAGFIAALVVLAGRARIGGAVARKAALAVVALLCVLTYCRNSVWVTDYLLWEDAVRQAPYSGRAHANLGLALAKQKRYFEAIDEFKQVPVLDPRYPQMDAIYNNIGKIYYDSGMLDDAVKEFEQALKTDPRCLEAYGNLGASFYKMGRYQDSVDVLEKAVGFAPGFTPAQSGLSLSYMRLGRNKEALFHAREALKTSPMDFDVNFNLALIYLDNGMKDKAAEQAETALSLAKDGPQRDDAAGLLNELRR
jgi:tetratricopeptide (TPR) repeat protein